MVVLKYLRPYDLTTLQRIANALDCHEEKFEACWLEENYIIPALGFPSPSETSSSTSATKTHCSTLPPRTTHQPSSKHNRPSISVQAKSEEDIRRIWKLYCHAIRLHNEGLKPEQSHPGPLYTGAFSVAQREEALKADKKTSTKLSGEMTFGQDGNCGLRVSGMSLEHSEFIKRPWLTTAAHERPNAHRRAVPVQASATQVSCAIQLPGHINHKSHKPDVSSSTESSREATPPYTYPSPHPCPVAMSRRSPLRPYSPPSPIGIPMRLIFPLPALPMLQAQHTSSWILPLPLISLHHPLLLSHRTIPTCWTAFIPKSRSPLSKFLLPLCIPTVVAGRKPALYRSPMIKSFWCSG